MLKRKDGITTFELKIEEFHNNNISGKIQDVLESGGTPGVGTINGELKGNHIKFVKQMPSRVMVLPNGKRITEDKPHKPIYYQGTINQETNTIEGSWKIKMRLGFSNGKILFTLGTKGKWKMKKVGDQI